MVVGGSLDLLLVIGGNRVWLDLLLVQETCPSVKNILLLDSEGKRVAVKYYSDDWPTLSAKLAFEKSVFAKTQKANAGTEGNLHLVFSDVIVLACSSKACVCSFFKKNM
jgi:hypothetical protein